MPTNPTPPTAANAIDLAVTSTEIPILGIRPRECAKAIGVSERTLFTITRGPNPPPHFRVGSAVIYPVDQLRSWLAQRSQSGGDNV